MGGHIFHDESHLMAQQSASIALGPALLGRDFVNPLFDYLLIGGGLSLLVAGVILINPLG